MRTHIVLAFALLVSALASGVAAADPGRELATSNLNTRAGRLTALRAGVSYAASTFPVRLSITPRDGSWSGTQWRTTSHGKPAFGWTAFGQGPTDAPPQGLIEILTAYGPTPSTAAVLYNLFSKGGGAVTLKPRAKVTVAGFHGWRIDGEVWGKWGQALVPFSPVTNGGAPPDFYRLGKGEVFRVMVLDVRGKRVVLILESAALPPEQFATFLASAGQLLATVRFGA